MNYITIIIFYLGTIQIYLLAKPSKCISLNPRTDDEESTKMGMKHKKIKKATHILAPFCDISWIITESS